MVYDNDFRHKPGAINCQGAAAIHRGVPVNHQGAATSTRRSGSRSRASQCHVGRASQAGSVLCLGCGRLSTHCACEPHT
jgi:hypothetical protein